INARRAVRLIAGDVTRGPVGRGGGHARARGAIWRRSGRGGGWGGGGGAGASRGPAELFGGVQGVGAAAAGGSSIDLRRLTSGVSGTRMRPRVGLCEAEGSRK